MYQLYQTNVKNEEQATKAEEIYNELRKMGVEALLDDRKEKRAGVKFKDSELMGIPMRITVGKMIGEGQVEFKLRNGGEVETLSIEEVYNRVREEFERANLSL